MSALLRRLALRARYYWRAALNFFGLCHRCGASLTYTTKGRGICMECGR